MPLRRRSDRLGDLTLVAAEQRELDAHRRALSDSEVRRIVEQAADREDRRWRSFGAQQIDAPLFNGDLAIERHEIDRRDGAGG